MKGYFLSVDYTPADFHKSIEDFIRNIGRIMNVSDVTFNGLNLAPLLNITFSEADPAVWTSLQQMQNGYINISDFDLAK